MHASHYLALLSLAASSWAITVTSPSQGALWPSSGPNTVSWTRVSTDPDSFAVTLVQQGVYKQTLAENVDATKGSLTITTSLPVGNVYQVNLVKSSQDLNSILAQSPQFNITQGSGTSSISATSTSATTGSSIGSKTATSTGTSASSGTNIPNASDSALNPTSTSSNAASPSTQYSGGFMGILILLGVALL